jgi:hypothetical protein
VVVPASKEEGDSRVEERQAEGILRVREGEREPAEEAFGNAPLEEERLALEAPDRDVVVRPHRLGQRLQRVERHPEDEDREEQRRNRREARGRTAGRALAEAQEARQKGDEGRQNEKRKPARRGVEREREGDGAGDERESGREAPGDPLGEPRPAARHERGRDSVSDRAGRDQDRRDCGEGKRERAHGRA